MTTSTHTTPFTSTGAFSTDSTAQGGQRAAVYVRVSSTGQEDGYSLDTQLERCRQHAAERGYHVVEVYREVFTGTELWERPQLTAMREAVRRHTVDVVIAHAIDRLSRDPVHMGVIISEADHAGVRVEFVSEPLDDSPEGQLIRFVRGYAAKVEHLKIVERTQRGKMARAKSGRLMAGRCALYGYQWAGERKERYIPHPDTAPVVQRIFREGLTGKSLRGIANELTAEGIPSPSGRGAWEYTAIRRILRDPMYAGQGATFRHRKEKRAGGTTSVRRLGVDEWIALPPGTVPPLVDEVTRAAAEERLRLNQERSVRNARHPEVALLRCGYVRCGDCGGAMVVQIQSPNTWRYSCMNATRANGTCRWRAIGTAPLDAAVWARVEALLTDPEVIERELARLRETDTTADDLGAVERTLAGVGKRQANLARIIAGMDDEEASEPLTVQLAELAEQKRRLVTERDAVLSRRERAQQAQRQLQDIQAWVRGVAGRLGNATWEQRRLALDALGVVVQVFPTDHSPRYVITARLPLPSDGRSASAHPEVVLRTNPE